MGNRAPVHRTVQKLLYLFKVSVPVIQHDSPSISGDGTPRPSAGAASVARPALPMHCTPHKTSADACNGSERTTTHTLFFCSFLFLSVPVDVTHYPYTSAYACQCAAVGPWCRSRCPCPCASACTKKSACAPPGLDALESFGTCKSVEAPSILGAETLAWRHLGQASLEGRLLESLAFSVWQEEVSTISGIADVEVCSSIAPVVVSSTGDYLNDARMNSRCLILYTWPC